MAAPREADARESISRAVLYLAAPQDAAAALRPVAGRPIAFRAAVAAARAGVSWIGVPAVFRGTALERHVAERPALRAAVVWLDEAVPAPDGAALLLPAAALVPAAELRALRRSSPPAVLADSRDGDAPVIAATPALVRELWPDLAAGRSVGGPLGRALQAATATPGAGTGGYARVASAPAARRAETLLYAALGSPIDTRLDTLVHRRLARPVTRLAARWNVAPNQVTLASLVAGLAAAWCFGRGELPSALAGLLLYVAAVVLDHADGEVARLTLTESPLGEWLDVGVDTTIHGAMVVALGVAAERVAGGGAALVGGVAALGVVASAALSKIAPLPRSAGGMGRLLSRLSNRNGFYALLGAHVAALAAYPPLLPAIMVGAAAGMHAFWVGYLAYRLGHRRGGPAGGRNPVGGASSSVEEAADSE